MSSCILLFLHLSVHDGVTIDGSDCKLLWMTGARCCTEKIAGMLSIDGEGALGFALVTPGWSSGLGMWSEVEHPGGLSGLGGR